MNYNFYKWSSDISDRLYAYFRPKRFIIRAFFNTIADTLDMLLTNLLIVFLGFWIIVYAFYWPGAGLNIFQKILLWLVLGEGIYLAVSKDIDLWKRIQQRHENGKHKRKQ